MRRTQGIVAAVLAAGALGAPASTLAAPPNDAPRGALAFRAVTAENGTPTEREATALLTDATADAGVPRCLGGQSFARTVWFRIESAATPRRIKVEASGQTTAAPDLAAFVQPPGATDTAPALAEPQACDGPGSPIADAGEGSSVVDLHVPAGHQVLIQAGRNAGQAAESVLLALDATPLPAQPAPAGDRGDGTAPALPFGAAATVDLAGATLTEEDPAQPACPAAASVWRRVDVPAGGGTLRAVADGPGVGTLTAFPGATPTGDGALDCANRARGNAVGLTFRARAGEPLWLRVGADAADAAPATLTVERAPAGATAVSGPGGGTRPGGGQTSTCTDRTAPTLRLTGGTAALRGAVKGRAARKRKPTLRGTAADKGCAGAKVRRIQVALQRKSGKRCQAVRTSSRPGRRGSCTRVAWLTAKGTTSWRLTFKRKLPKGTYVLRVRARDAAGNASKTTRTTFTVGRKTRT